jgi:hypothetical protein
VEDQSSRNVQGASGLTLAARLNQQALLPDMMFPTVNRFNPDNGQPLPTSNGETPSFYNRPGAVQSAQLAAKAWRDYLHSCMIAGGTLSWGLSTILSQWLKLLMGLCECPCTIKHSPT